MTAVNFSLTQHCLTFPILRLSAEPLDTKAEPLSIGGHLSYLVQSQIITRVMAVATPLFSSIDCLVHLSMGMIKTIPFALNCIHVRLLSSTPLGIEILHHFKHAAKFFVLATVGSAMAVLFPPILKYFLMSGFDPDGSGVNWDNAPEKVKELWSQVTDTATFRALWDKASIVEKRIFVTLLDRDNSATALLAKTSLVSIIYKKVQGSAAHNWPQQQGPGIFYHATSSKGLEGILKSRRIEVRHEKAYRGAFVSTKPETSFGKYVLVLDRSGERLSVLQHGFNIGNAYWAGHAGDIPVTANNLKKVLVTDASSREVSTLSRDCQTWTGRSITVESFDSRNSTINANQEIPKEWPGDDPHAAAIHQTLRIRAVQAVQVGQRQSFFTAIMNTISVSLPNMSQIFARARRTRPIRTVINAVSRQGILATA